MHFAGKECDAVPYIDAYETIKLMSIVQSDTTYDNTETGETAIIMLKKLIWMGEAMDHTLVNPNQFFEYGMTVQDNPFAEAPILIPTEDCDFMLSLSSKGNILGVATRNPIEKDL